MAIEGPLKELGIHDVFQLLDLNRKTGVLRLMSELRHNQGVVWFHQGTVVYAEIQSNPHPLGDLLVRAGKVSEADLERARKAQDEHGDDRRIGDILVDMNALSAAELERQVRFQIEEVIFEMMSWREGYFSFSEEPIDGVPAEAITHIRVESLLMEAARRIDEWSRMERKIPHVGVVPALAPMAEGEQGALDLLPNEWEVLALIDGKRDIRALAKLLARSEFDVAKTIFGLESASVLTILKRPSGEAVSADPGWDVASVIGEAEDALARRDLTSARGMVESALGTYPHEPRLYVVLGRVHLGAARDVEAEDCFRRALRLDPLLARAHRLLGHALARQGRFAEAASWWGRWLTLREQAGEPADSPVDVEEAIRAATILDQFLKV